MEPEVPLIQGILLLPPQGMLGQLKKSWHKRFCQLFKASNYGIERLEIYDNHEEAILQLHSPRIVTLEACVKIAPSNHSHVFTVVTKSGVHYFGCCSVADMYNWISAFQLVAFKDKLSKQTIEENSDLYCTNGERVFSVKVVETDASKRCGLETRTYTLVVAAVDIKLMDGDIVLFTWPYRYIRRYGYKDGKFTFEAGRKCESGEGSFCLEHGSQQEIFRCMYLKMKSMKKLLNGDNSPSIECNDTQYHAALSMEAGSRSPLPPSPNSSANLIDIDFAAITPNSQKQLNSSSGSDSTTASKPSPPIVRPKPAKPPRKNIFTGLLDKKNIDSDNIDSPSSSEQKTFSNTNSPELSQKSVSSSILEEEKHSYDLVEVRNDAWKTHGTDNVHHTEKYNPSLIKNNTDKENNEDSQYETMMPVTTFQNLSKNKNNASEVISISSSMFYTTSCKTPDTSDYDELQNFGSASKLIPISMHKISTVSSSTQNTHNTAQSTVSNPTADSNATWSNYDIVEDISSVRLADDSHLGYAVIRKKIPIESTSINANMGPKPEVYNDGEYAIVSKPKRV
ncbi:uncharacterized protein LOC122520813 [Polistes fuscatus]|uniref:uncharacterized protein LOC122520813 n=1 Tax=Polistes fuscatus TaxID=30207 RepID=UPI001CA80DFF|nr:uncharacterized protein LOC122520813 [Polistes fuscatus]